MDRICFHPLVVYCAIVISLYGNQLTDTNSVIN